MKNKSISYIVSLITTIGFIFNIIWENIHVQLYEGYVSFWQYLPFSFLSALGDIVIILGIYFVFVFAYHDTRWVDKLDIEKSFFIILIGILVATIIEIFSLKIGLWAYRDNMPIIPIFNVGLSPIIQMAILPFITFKISSILNLKRYKN